jgi:hypothetical protein
MDSRSEAERVEVNGGLDSMPANPWTFHVEVEVDADALFLRLQDVLRAVVDADSDNWPADEYWEGRLPGWMKVTLARLTQEQSDQLLKSTPRADWDKLPWEFGSWIDAIRDRGWRWWGYQVKGSSANIVVHIAQYPERIDAFRQLLSAAGAVIKSESYADLD